jgi:hypothetical protein
VVRTGAGLLLVAWFVLPIPRWLLGELKTDFSEFLVGGLMIVIGASWVIMYNADVLLRLLSASLRHVRSLAPVLRMSIAYPLRNLFRTGVTFAMFTLVVFTLVVGAVITGSFVDAFNDVDSFGGGSDVRAQALPVAPIENMASAVRRVPGVNPGDIRLVSSQSSLPVKARQLGEPAKAEDYVVRGVDATFLRHTTYRLAMTARGYDSPRAVWNAIHANRGLAVVDPWIVPRKANYGGGGGPDFQLRGFYLEDRTLGFMGLGLVGGVAALGVISARAVVERRQQIGVLRAIGFRRRMIQLSFFFESSFIALTSIVVGTLLGLAVALNVIYGAADQSGMENLSFDVPWLTLAVIFLAVYAVALLTTLEPARRASRVFPAEALRYQ